MEENDIELIRRFCKLNVGQITDSQFIHLLILCQFPAELENEISNGTHLLIEAMVKLSIHPLKLAEYCTMLNAFELASMLETLPTELGWVVQSTEDYLTDFMEEKTVNNLMKTLKMNLTSVDISKLVFDTSQNTFEFAMKEMYRSQDLSSDLTELISILEDIDKDELAAEVGSFKSDISKLSNQDFKDQLVIYLDSFNV